MSAREEFEKWKGEQCFQKPPQYALDFAFGAYKAGLEAAAKVCRSKRVDKSSPTLPWEMADYLAEEISKLKEES